MKIFTLILLLSLATNQILANPKTNAIFSVGESTSYASPTGHFKLSVPAYWKVINPIEIEKYKDKLKQNLPNRYVPNYILGLQRKSIYNFTLPYLLVELDRQTPPTMSAVLSQANTFATSVSKAYLPLHRKGLFGSVKAMPAHYDPNKKMILGYSEMFRNSDQVNLQAITAIFPCQLGYLRFNFFSNMKNLDRDIEDIFEIIDSITFDSGYEYVPTDEKHSNELWRKTIYGIIFVLALAWFAIRFWGRKRMQREPF